MSNYAYDTDPETVREAEQREVRCPACRGFGFVEVHGQETDCIDCQGYGSVLV